MASSKAGFFSSTQTIRTSETVALGISDFTANGMVAGLGIVLYLLENIGMSRASRSACVVAAMLPFGGKPSWNIS